MSAPKTVNGWTMFWPGPRMSKHEDGRRLPGDPVEVGGQVTLIGGQIKPCEWGLHGSELLLDALGYAPCERPVIGYCEFGGEIERESDKLAARSRTLLWALDEAQTETVLRIHARWSALGVLHLWDAPGVVVRYLVTGDEVLRAAAGGAAWVAARAAVWAAARDAARVAARAAVWAAARDAARAAARDAAWPAAWPAAWSAAGDAARDAAWAAARAAARDAAWAAAWSAAGDAARDAAWAAAWAAAWDAAWDASNAELERLAWAAHRGEPVTLAIPESAREIVARVIDGAA